MPGEQHAFDGTLVTVSFGTTQVRRTVTKEYNRLVAEYSPDDVLVLTGSPTSTDTFEDLLADELPGATVPRVTTPILHATDVVNRADDRTILSDALRRELVHRFLDDREWDHAYLAHAATQESFTADVAQLMQTATWQGASLDATPELAAIGSSIEEFHAWLAEHDHLERGQLLTEAESILETGTQDGLVDASALLVVEFEEFQARDRAYLQTVADDRFLVCVAETNASVRRTWAEPRPVTAYVSFTERRSVDGTDPETRPAAAATHLAREKTATEPDDGDVHVLAATTPDEEIEMVGDEIERLREQHDWGYDQFAIACKHGGDEILDVVHALEGAGVPTESATVIGFGDDPAIRELLQVVHELAVDESTSELTPETNATDPALLDEIGEMDNVDNAIRRWATESNLKQRIAENATPLDARSRFGNLRRAFQMGDFLEDTDFLDATWSSYATMLEHAHEYAARHGQTSAIDRDGGVRVDHLQSLKNGSFRVVFLPHCIDDVYPGTPNLSSLFPRERVTEMPDYPGVTQVDADDVTATFETTSTAASSPIRRYHAEHARRQLAVGAATATDRLYFTLHEHADTALDETVQPSRLLVELYRTLPWLTDADEPAIETERAAEEYLLSRVDRALADVRRVRSQDVTISLDDVETDLAEMQALLDESGDRGDQLREALRARVDFAAGRVSRE